MDPHVCHDKVNISFEKNLSFSKLVSTNISVFPTSPSSTTQSPISIKVEQLMSSTTSIPSLNTASFSTPFDKSGDETFEISDDFKTKFEKESFINSNFSSCNSLLPDIVPNFNWRNSNNSFNYKLRNNFNFCNLLNLDTKKLDSELKSSKSEGFALCNESDVETYKELTSRHFIKRANSEPKSFVNISKLFNSSFASSLSLSDISPIEKNGVKLIKKN